MACRSCGAEGFTSGGLCYGCGQKAEAEAESVEAAKKAACAPVGEMVNVRVFHCPDQSRQGQKAEDSYGRTFVRSRPWGKVKGQALGSDHGDGQREHYDDAREYPWTEWNLW